MHTEPIVKRKTTESQGFDKHKHARISKSNDEFNNRSEDPVIMTIGCGVPTLK